MKSKIENKKLNNLYIVILVFKTSKFRNIGRCTFDCSKYQSPPCSMIISINENEQLSI